jgi:hypothetical protein
MNTKTWLIIFGGTFGLLIVSAIIGNILESNGTLKTLSPEVETAVMIFYFALFCVLGFSIVPLALKLFISAQIKIGNGELFLVKWLQAHEQGFICGVWIMFIIGLCISLPAAIKDGFFK